MPDRVIGIVTVLGEEMNIIASYEQSLLIRNYQPSSLRRNIQVATRFYQTIDSVKALDARSIEHYLFSLLEAGRSPKTVKNHRSALKVFCDFLCCHGYLKDNPVLKVPSIDLPEEIPVCLPDDEIAMAYQVAKRVGLLCEVSLALNTGLRMEEMRRLEWHDVDLLRRQLIVRKAKGKRPRTVPLNAQVCEVLEKQQQQYGHLVYVFPGGKPHEHRRGNWTQPNMRGKSWWQKRSIKPLQRELPTLRDMQPGRTGRGWHIFRHTFATKCVLADIDIVKLRDWMGHRKIETTLRYVHVARHYDPDIEKLNFSVAA
ncbi:MAG: tyrosine-type recombinase/integrase [Phycisphaeraceae bacterium JB051]